MGTVKGDEAEKRKIGMFPCHGQGGNQVNCCLCTTPKNKSQKNNMNILNV